MLAHPRAGREITQPSLPIFVDCFLRPSLWLCLLWPSLSRQASSVSLPRRGYHVDSQSQVMHVIFLSTWPNERIGFHSELPYHRSDRTTDIHTCKYEAPEKGLYVVWRNFFLLLVNCCAQPCLGHASQDLQTFSLHVLKQRGVNLSPRFLSNTVHTSKTQKGIYRIYTQIAIVLGKTQIHVGGAFPIIAIVVGGYVPKLEITGHESVCSMSVPWIMSCQTILLG